MRKMEPVCEPMPPATWREQIAIAAAAVPEAYMRRRAVMRAAHEAGLSLRAISEACGLSASAVSKIIGPVKPASVSLDSRVDGHA